MEYFIAKTDRQLGICLLMLYAEEMQGDVEAVENSSRKIEFHIRIAGREQIPKELETRYKILIS